MRGKNRNELLKHPVVFIFPFETKVTKDPTIKFKSIFSGLTCNSLIFYFSGLLLFYLADSRKIKTKFQRHFGKSLTRTVKLLNLHAHRLPARRYWMAQIKWLAPTKKAAALARSRFFDTPLMESWGKRLGIFDSYCMLSLVETQNIILSNESISKITYHRNKTSRSWHFGC